MKIDEQYAALDALDRKHDAEWLATRIADTIEDSGSTDSNTSSCSAHRSTNSTYCSVTCCSRSNARRARRAASSAEADARRVPIADAASVSAAGHRLVLGVQRGQQLRARRRPPAAPATRSRARPRGGRSARMEVVPGPASSSARVLSPAGKAAWRRGTAPGRDVRHDGSPCSCSCRPCTPTIGSARPLPDSDRRPVVQPSHTWPVGSPGQVPFRP